MSSARSDSKDHIAVRFYPEIAAGGFCRVDGTIEFWQRVNALVEPQFTVLDFGAGRGMAHFDDAVHYRRNLQRLKGKVREVVGADVDPVVATNPSLDRAVLIGDSGRIPIDSASVDMVVSDFTFEHLEKPEIAASELDRVLKVGGWICARTPNRNGYIATANRVIPQRTRRAVLKIAQPGRQDEDVFPAFYRLNTAQSLRRHFSPVRFDHAVYSWEPDPGYHANVPAIYWLNKTFSGLTPAPFKNFLMVFLHKTA